MNSKELERKLQSDSSRAARLASSDLSATATAEELYLAVFSRMPSAAESAYVIQLLQSAEATNSDARVKQRRKVLQDLLWALINAPECSIQN